jgi:hypothetical protein
VVHEISRTSQRRDDLRRFRAALRRRRLHATLGPHADERVDLVNDAGYAAPPDRIARGDRLRVMQRRQRIFVMRISMRGSRLWRIEWNSVGSVGCRRTC